MHLSQAAIVALSFMAPAALYAQALSIVNYQVVSQSTGTFRTNVTYRADLINSGGPLGSVTATLTSKNLLSFTVVPGHDTLTFSPVPANSHVSSTNTVTLLVNPDVPFDLANAQWDFQVIPVAPIANAGPNQSAKLNSTVVLDGSGSVNPSSIGTLSYFWAFASRPGGSSATLNNPTSVRPSFVLDVPGDYVVTLTVGNGVNSGSANVTVSTIYTPPVANAGPDQTVTVGTTVILNGSRSTDVNGQPLSYAWTLTSLPPGSAAALKASNTISASFVVDKPGSYTAQLVVNDTKSNSSPATVTITTINSPPVAHAGRSRLVNVNDLVQLDGSQSTDVDGDLLSYTWSILSAPPGSSAILSSSTVVTPTFTVDVAGTYVVQLIVNDGKVDSKAVTILLTTDTVLPPTAVPGENQTVLHKTFVTLNGAGVDPQGLPLTFQWTLLSKPAGSQVTLVPSLPTQTFLADMPGTYVAQLVVSSAYLDSAPANITITTTNTPPAANAGQNQNVMVGSTVVLNGIASFDPDQDPLTYSWSLLSRPPASKTKLSAANNISATFVADAAGTYVAQLIVNDGYTNSTPATVSITAIQTTKLIITPSSLTIAATSSGTFTVTLAGPAGVGGQVINLTNFNPNVASVPASVVVAEGYTAVNVTVAGKAAGNTAIYVTGPGLLGAFASVNVIPGSIIVATDSSTFGPTRSANGTVTLSSPAGPDGVVVTLSSTPPGIVDVQPSVITIAGGGSTGTFTAKGVAIGTATITASSPAFVSGSTPVSVVLVGFIALPSQLTIGLGQSALFPITLATPAPLGGVNIAVSSDNPSVTITPSNVFIPFRATTPPSQPVINGVNVGSAHISAAAAGFAGSNPTTVQVTANLTFLPQNINIITTNTANLTLTLSGLAPASGLTLNLRSDNPAVATVPATVTFMPFMTTVSVPVTGVAPGTTMIHAGSDVIADAAASVLVFNGSPAPQ